MSDAYAKHVVTNLDANTTTSEIATGHTACSSGTVASLNALEVAVTAVVLHVGELECVGRVAQEALTAASIRQVIVALIATVANATRHLGFARALARQLIALRCEPVK